MAEPPQPSRVGAPRNQLRLSNLPKISRYRGEDKTRRRFEVVEQAAPSTLSFPERNSLDTNSVLDVSELTTSGRFSLPSTEKPKLTLAELVAPVADDLFLLNDNLQKVVGADHHMLMAAAKQLFSAGGKRMRPALVFLVSRATCQLSNIQELRLQHRRLAEITEMIHKSSRITKLCLRNRDTPGTRIPSSRRVMSNKNLGDWKLIMKV